MRDYQASVEKIRRDAEEAASIRDHSVDKVKRDVFDRLHEHLNMLADDVERVIAKTASPPKVN